MSLDAFIVMPNHIHAVVMLNSDASADEAAAC